MEGGGRDVEGVGDEDDVEVDGVVRISAEGVRVADCLLDDAVGVCDPLCPSLCCASARSAGVEGESGGVS